MSWHNMAVHVMVTSQEAVATSNHGGQMLSFQDIIINFL